jgi:hydroxypyruvate reductase/glycerate 2-kinase
MLIKNYDELVKESDLRRKALEIVEAGLESLKPEKVIGEKVRLKKNFLIIQDWKGKSQKFNLSHYKKIVVVGFGKATSFLAKEIEKILDFRIKDGLVIDTTLANLKKVKAIKGTHPFPSLKNIKATEKLVELIKNLTKEDLIICLVAGGGSALLCLPKIDFSRYLEIIKNNYRSGIDIKEFNAKRRKLSKVKGGKLAKFTQAKIISLIFSDVPGDSLRDIASGPTFGRNLKNVKNILVLNNTRALQAMIKKARQLGLKPMVLTKTLKGEARLIGKNLVKKIKKIKNKNCFLFGGETTVKIKGKGTGGRNQELCLGALQEIGKLEKGVLISLNTDGKDGQSKAAGAIVDERSDQKAWQKNLNPEQFLKENNSYFFFKKLNDLIFIEPKLINIADIGVILKNNK